MALGGLRCGDGVRGLTKRGPSAGCLIGVVLELVQTGPEGLCWRRRGLGVCTWPRQGRRTGGFRVRIRTS